MPPALVAGLSNAGASRVQSARLSRLTGSLRCSRWLLAVVDQR